MQHGAATTRGAADDDRVEAAAPSTSVTLPYRRVLLKLSGEVFGGGAIGVDPDVVALDRPADRRGRRAAARRSRSSSAAATSSAAPSCPQRGMDRDRADYMGMLGTVMNCLALQDFLEKAGVADPRADRDHDGPGRRALHPAPRRAAPREGPRRDLRRRRRAAVLLHRHRRRAARARDRLPGAAARQERRRRRVRRRPAHRTRTRSSSTRSATTRCCAAGCKVADATAFSLCRDNGMPIVVFELWPTATSPGSCAVRRSARWSAPPADDR